MSEFAADEDHHLLGKAGRANVLETLNAQGPQGIAEFQESQGLNGTANVKPILPLLDLHGVGRPDLYKKLLLMLRQRLLQKLSTLSDDNLNDLLHVKSMHMSENVHWSICYPNAFEHQTSQDLQTGIMHNHADMHSATMTSFIHQRNQTIPYIRIPELRPVALEVLKRHKDIPQYCLDLVGADQALLNACGYTVKRQLWKKNPAQFLVVVSPLISQYVTMIRIQSKNSDFDTVAKMAIRQRRKAPEVAELVKCVGEEFNLYLALLQELRAGFLRTGDPGYGALRTDLLLVLNETGVTGISRRDPCLHFARVLSGCAAGERREVDGPRAKELVRTAHTSVKDLAPVLGDLGTRVKFEISEDAAGFGLNPLPTTGCRVLAPGIANLTCANVMTLHIEGMTLIDPVINHMLLSNLNRALRASVARRRMPQENEQLQALVTLLVMGSKARERIRSQDFSGNTAKEELHIVKKVLPQLAGLMVEDAIVEADPAMDKAVRGTLPETLLSSIAEYPFVGGCVMYYMLDCLKATEAWAGTGGGPDIQGVVRTLPILVDTVTGNWHHSPGDGSANVLEQFARTLLNRCRTQALPTLAKLDAPSVRLFTVFFVPRAALSTDCHAQVLVLLKALARAHPEVCRSPVLVEMVQTTCADGAEPDDLKSKEAAGLREAYEALLQSALAGGEAEEPLEDRLVALTPAAEVKETEADEKVGLNTADRGDAAGTADGSGSTAVEVENDA